MSISHERFKIKPFEDWPELMTPEDVKEYLGFGHIDAYQLFKQPGFPLVMNVKRNKRVGKYALREFLNKGAAIQTKDTAQADRPQSKRHNLICHFSRTREG